MISLNLDKIEENQSPILDRKLIMETFGVSKSTLHRWLHNYGLKFYKVNRRVFVKREDFDEWFEGYRNSYHTSHK